MQFSLITTYFSKMKLIGTDFVSGSIFFVLLSNCTSQVIFKRNNVIFFFLIIRKITYSDLQTIAPEQYMKQITKRLTELYAVSVSIYLHL